MMLRESDLQGLMSGSYEERLTRLSEAVTSKFGDRAVLVSTFVDNIVVLNENSLMRASYRIGKDVTFDDIASIGLGSERDIVREGMDSFLGGGSIRNALTDLVSHGVATHVSPYAKVKREMQKLMGEGAIWRERVAENRTSILRDISDRPFLSSSVFCKFGDGLLESGYDLAIEEATDLEGKVASLLATARESLSHYRNEASGHDVKEAMMHFESFATDYIEHLEGILGIVSRVIEEGRADCAAFVHDSVAEAFEDMEIGSRMIQHISNEFRRTK